MSIDPLAIECPTCGQEVGVSCSAFEDGETNHFTRAIAAPEYELYVVDLERHNDGESGLVGPFNSRKRAQHYIDTLQPRDAKYATIRPVQEA